MAHAETPPETNWPPDDLEPVAACPFCQSQARTLALPDVADWTFNTAPGKWNYWRCDDCAALYLDPRPTPASIGRAYGRYYTHASATGSGTWTHAKTWLRHTCYLAWYGIALRPRLPLPRLLYPLLAPLRSHIAEPFFILHALNRLPRGRLLDIGCGNGASLLQARQLGWSVRGLEIDAHALAAARAHGLDVEPVNAYELQGVRDEYDCVVCSHVIEHVHQPLRLLECIQAALKPGGVALLSLPNADSWVLQASGIYWRGLEAPRHLAIPTARALRAHCEALGFRVLAAPVSPWPTLAESVAIARRCGVDLQAAAEQVQRSAPPVDALRSDFINLELLKP